MTMRSPHMTLFVAVGIVALATTSAVFTPHAWGQAGIDLLGKDYKGFEISTPDPGLCKKACDDDRRCRAYTYVRPGYQSANARCYLKSEVPAPVRNDCCTSGIKAAVPIGPSITATEAPRPPAARPPQPPQATMGRFSPQCDPTLSVPEVPALSLSCEQETWADFILRECAGAFWDKIDALAQTALTFDNLQNTANVTYELYDKGKELVEQIAELSAGVEVYAAKCAVTGVLKFSPETGDAYAVLEATKKAVDHLKEANEGLQKRLAQGGDIRLHGDERTAWDELKRAYGTGDVMRKLKDALVKVYDEYRGPEAVSLDQLISANSSTRLCRIPQADAALRQAGQTAVRALAQAEYRRAKAIRVRGCKLEAVRNALNKMDPSYIAGDRWQRDSFIWMSCGTYCEEWRAAVDAENDAQAAAERLRKSLASVNAACQELKSVDDMGRRQEDSYYAFMRTAKNALSPGRCDVADAKQAVTRMQVMEEDACIKAAGLNASADLAAQIDKRSKEPACVSGPAQGGTLVGMCHVAYEGQMYKGQWVPGAKPKDESIVLRWGWDAAHRVYSVTFGSGQRAVGSSTSFSFSDGCEQGPPYRCDSRCEKDFVPGCIYKSRSSWLVKGNVAVSASSGSLQLQWYDRAGGFVSQSKGTTTCNLKKP